MTWKEIKEYIRGDLARMTTPSYLSALRYLVCNASFKITFWFRLGFISSPPIISLIIRGISQIILKHYNYKTGIQVWPGADIGKGLCFGHFSCIVIAGGYHIGENCTVLQGVTIGSVRGKGAPSIGNNVVISANSLILGNINIGDNVMIGAGSVVIRMFQIMLLL